MKISVDRQRCEGHGMCEAAAPEMFTLDDDGELEIHHQGVVPPGLVDAAADAVRLCPVAALRAEP
jgi:ferredoxin